MGMKTVMYLLRHGATTANLERPAKLQGRRADPPLAPLGLRQAVLTRGCLAIRPLDACYTSPLRRARQTATILCEPHGIEPTSLGALTECDVGRWEGLSWETIRQNDPDAYLRFMDNPAGVPYPGGESFGDVLRRVAPALEELLREHEGEAILVVAHHVTNRTYLANLLGVPPEHARRVKLDNCGISVVVHQGGETTVQTLNATFHLQG